MKVKIYKFLFFILIALQIIVIGLIIKKHYNNYINEKENNSVVVTFLNNLKTDQNDQKQEQEEVTLNGYKVIGIIKIPKIELEYPILDIDVYNPEETKAPMKYAIVKYWGGKVNELGNLSIAGHNNYDGTMFGKTKKLELQDKLELVDLDGNTIEYEIYDKFVTNPNDISILETKDENIRVVTLITCTNGNKQRLILKAKEL